jgi:CARDB
MTAPRAARRIIALAAGFSVAAGLALSARGLPHPERLPDLVPDLTTLPATATVGKPRSFQVRVRNVGDAPAAGVAVRVFLPKPVDVVRVGGTGVTDCIAAEPAGLGATTVDCTAPAIGVGRAVTVDIMAVPIAGLISGDRLRFRAQVDPLDTVREKVETNNIADGTVTVTALADLEIAIVSVTRARGAIALPAPQPAASLCQPEGTSHADTTVRVRVTNHGPGQSPATALALQWATGVGRDVFSDCPAGSSCNSSGACLPGPQPPPPPGADPCFDRCAVRGLLPGAAQEFVFHVRGGRNLSLLGTAVVDPAPATVDDPERANNSTPIR